MLLRHGRSEADRSLVFVRSAHRVCRISGVREVRRWRSVDGALNPNQKIAFCSVSSGSFAAYSSSSKETCRLVLEACVVAPRRLIARPGLSKLPQVVFALVG